MMLALLGLVLPVRSLAQSRAITLPRNISQLVEESPAVVQGWVTQVKLEPSSHLRNLLTVAVTLQLEETLKGKARGEFTFRQAVIDARDRDRKMGYQPGQHLLLIVIKPNKYGLSSTAGMEQGRFRIQQARDGAVVAVNGVSNAGLFREMPAQLQDSPSLSAATKKILNKPNPGPVALDQLKSVIRELTAMGRK